MIISDEYSVSCDNNIARFSLLRWGVLAVLYLILSVSAVIFIYRLLYPENLYYNSFMMLISGEKSIMESGILVLLLLTLPLFLMLIYNSLSLLFICLSIDGGKCFIKKEGSSARYSYPDIGRGWSVEYNSGYVNFATGNVKSIYTTERWNRFHLVPVREICIELRDGRSIVIDSIFFKEHLSDIKAHLEFMAFPNRVPEPQKRVKYREGESIFDEEGNFIPPGNE